MSQTSPQSSGSRRTTPPDLDALLESLNADVRSPSGAPPMPPTGQQAGTLTERRVQALIRAFDVLHKQVAAIASQGETISKVAENQARDAQSIAELQRNIKALRGIVIQQLQQGSYGASTNLPPIQIKLVVGHLAERYQQAERDMAALLQWAMLFVGLAVGVGAAAVVSLLIRAPLIGAAFGSVAVVTLLVALIFGGLARSARSRAADARRAMDESTLLRSITLPTDAQT